MYKRWQVNQVESWDAVNPDLWKDAPRAAGECLCECGQQLWKHGQPLPEMCPTIVQDCEGGWWKL